MSEVDDKYVDDKGLQTRSLLEDGFLENIGKAKGPLKKALSKQVSTVKTSAQATTAVNANTENILIKSYDVRDTLIGTFDNLELGSPLANNITGAINGLGDIISQLGGESETFDPLSHVSGLQAPNMQRNAERAIENTKYAYTIGKVDDTQVSGKTVIVSFNGQSGETQYKAVGTITAKKEWLGTEAIDYIYTPGEGKMSVKVATENGLWSDKSEDYDINWELFENSGSEENAENVEKKPTTTEEPDSQTVNNVIDEIGDDFPIEEK